jgi:hypothetical protein
MLILSVTSCGDPVENREVVAMIHIKKYCDLLFSDLEDIPVPTDSVDVVMRFVDIDTVPLVDADIIRRVFAADTLLKLNLRLKKSDAWAITDLLKTYNNDPYCRAFCSDTTRICKFDPQSSTRLGKFHNVRDTIYIRHHCSCLLWQ